MIARTSCRVTTSGGAYQSRDVANDHLLSAPSSLPLPLRALLSRYRSALWVPRLLRISRHLRLNARRRRLPDTTVVPFIETLLEGVIALDKIDSVGGEEVLGAAAAAGFSAAHGAEAVAAFEGAGFAVYCALLAGHEEEEGAEGGKVGGYEDGVGFDSGGGRLALPGG